ncbi:hypothetical protein BH24CHL6_BH24CHL6_12730 [soil metagenome]
MRNPRSRARREGGQAIVVLAISLSAVLAMSALLIDGGNAMAQQRGTQNAADAASYAGASEILQGIAGASRTDGDVLNAIRGALSVNGNTNLLEAQYVDYSGNVVGTVGQGGAIPGSAAGVRVEGERDFPTYLAGVVNLNTMEVGAQATALAGQISGICAAVDGCAMAPVTFSIPIITCDGTNRPLRIGQEWPLTTLENAQAGDTSTMSLVPLCVTGPGGVGWLDMGDVGCPGNNMAQWITTPCNESFDVPIWLKTQPGNMNNLENAMNTHQGKVILIPMFGDTCREVPSSGLPQDCTNPGQGNNIWYHIPQFAAFYLYEAYITGNDSPACNSAPGQPLGGGNGATSCMKGWFINYITVGPVGPTCTDNSPECTIANSRLGIQLVR